MISGAARTLGATDGAIGQPAPMAQDLLLIPLG
jgi:hypothetical protein